MFCAPRYKHAKKILRKMRDFAANILVFGRLKMYNIMDYG